VPIIVNGIEITDEDVLGEMQHHPSPTKEDAHVAAAQALVIRELLTQEAEKKGLRTKDGDRQSDDDAIFKLIEAEVTAPEADEDICRRYYEQNKARFKAVDIEDDDVYVPFDGVHDKIRDYLHTQSVREGVRAYIFALAQDAKIAGFDLAKMA